MGLWANALFALIIFNIERMNLQNGLEEINPSNKINLNSLPAFHLIFLIVLYSFFPINDLDHEAELSTSLSLTVVDIEVVEDEEVFGLDSNLSAIECF